MPYKYCKIYNATKATYAYDVSGNDNPELIWKSNDWDENDALVGFYNENDDVFYNVIFCTPGYAIYVLYEGDKNNSTYSKDDKEYRIPPAMLVNLNEAFDTNFLHSKNYPSNDSDSDSDESDSDSDDSDSECETVKAEYVDNQPIIDFLVKCKNETDNIFKKRAYDNAIAEVQSMYTKITIYMLDNKTYYYNGSRESWKMGDRMRDRISEFILNL
jgi:hypothetical protein